ncbi:MAG: translational machinery protein [Myxococcales bacterium]|nr:translational machinery protein [Myxococcales bacterium]
MTFHAVVWLDHQQARVFHITAEAFDEATFKAPKHHVTSSHGARDQHARGETREAAQFFEAIARALSDSQEILVLGPGTAKLALVKHMHKHDPKVEARIVGVETADHPTDAQIVAHARAYFRTNDPLLGR